MHVDLSLWSSLTFMVRHYVTLFVTLNKPSSVPHGYPIPRFSTVCNTQKRSVVSHKLVGSHRPAIQDLCEIHFRVMWLQSEITWKFQVFLAMYRFLLTSWALWIPGICTDSRTACFFKDFTPSPSSVRIIFNFFLASFVNAKT